VLAVPLAAISLLVLARTIFRGVRWSKWSFISALVVLALDGFALYLALGHHHLIDWLEGH
jgi:Na+-driven multidrug efflux pump